MNENPKKTINTDTSNIKTKLVVAVLCIIVFVVVGFYLVNFHDGLSEKNEVWGTFGDYVGGILNPVIAAFAFYLIAKTYELQKRELEATRSLLGVSTNAQKDQIKLAALTALLNSNFTRISSLAAEKTELFKQQDIVKSNIFPPEHFMAQDQRDHLSEIRHMLVETENKINELKEKNNRLEGQIRDFL
ncbi:MAG: hypothetical protein ACXW1W_17665 [Methylococcaceae bacterium]